LLQWRVKTDDPNYIENWQQEMELMCVPRAEINYMVMAYSAAYGLAGLCLFPLPDRWGSKKTMAVFGSIHFAAQLILLLVPSYTFRLLGFLLMGLC